MEVCIKMNQTRLHLTLFFLIHRELEAKQL